MDEQDNKNFQVVTGGFHRVWTFRISAGPPFQLTLPNHFPLDYQGGVVIWKLVGSKGLADSALGIMEGIGATVDVFFEEETSEQTEERIATIAGIDPFPFSE